MAKKEVKSAKTTPTIQSSPVVTPQTTEKNWFYIGDEGYQRKKQKDVFNALRKEKSVARFFLKNHVGADPNNPENEAVLVFVDSKPFYCNIHQFKIGNRWDNFLTCIADFAPCPVCAKLGKPPVFTAHYTVIDTRSFIRQDGKEVKNRKILYPAKGSSIDKLKEIEDKYKGKGGLTGLVIRVKRYADEPNCGGTFEVKGRIDIAKKYGAEFAIPIDYKKVLAPPTEEELASMNFTPSIIGGSDDMITESVNDDILSDLGID